MNIRLLNYKGKEYFCEIPDNTEEINISIVSGDMIMTYPKHFDTGENTRIISFYDGNIILSKDMFHILDEIKESYEIFEHKNY